MTLMFMTFITFIEMIRFERSGIIFPYTILLVVGLLLFVFTFIFRIGCKCIAIDH